MVRFSKLIAGAALALALAAAPAQAGTVCAKRELIIKVLEENHQEKVAGIGVLDSATGVVELYVGPDPKRTFSIVVTDINGLSCITLTGEGWTGKAAPEKGA